MKNKYKNYKKCLKDQELTYNNVTGYLNESYEDIEIYFLTKDNQKIIIQNLNDVYLNGKKITEVLFKERDPSRKHQNYIGYLQPDINHFELKHVNNASFIYWPSISNLYFE